MSRKPEVMIFLKREHKLSKVISTELVACLYNIGVITGSVENLSFLQIRLNVQTLSLRCELGEGTAKSILNYEV
jgi:hypothetical protein